MGNFGAGLCIFVGIVGRLQAPVCSSHPWSSRFQDIGGLLGVVIYGLAGVAGAFPICVCRNGVVAGGLMMLTLPLGMNFQLKLSHTHLLGLSTPPLACNNSCHVSRLRCRD